MTLRAVLLSRGGDFIHSVEAETLRQITYHQRMEDSQLTLRTWRRREVHVRCGCGCVMHVVQGKRLFHLRRNPRRRTGEGEEPRQTLRTECDLCRTVRERQRSREYHVGRLPRPAEPTGLILHSRRISKGEQNRKPRRGGGGGGKVGKKYASAYAHMLGVWERCGFTRYVPASTGVVEGPALRSDMRWKDVWERLDNELAGSELWDAAGGVNNTSAYFAWMPGGRRRGGMVEVNRRLINDWRHPEFEPETQIWTMLEEVPKSETVMIPQVTSSMAEKQRREGMMPLEPYKRDVPRHLLKVIGGTPPYLALVVASDNRTRKLEYAKPEPHRLVLYSIASPFFPVPVESSHEREVALHLRAEGVIFVKPVFEDAEGLRPDFELPKQKVLIEVQGMNLDEYRESKEETHRKLMDGDRYKGWRLVRYDPNEGERFEEFKRRLDAELTLEG